MSNTPKWRSWKAMREPYLKGGSKDYPRYGGAGITVCERWATSFEAFLKDMGERPPGTSIDRYPDRTGNYEPGNCRWATDLEQQRNRRSTKLHTLHGKTQCQTPPGLRNTASRKHPFIPLAQGDESSGGIEMSDTQQPRTIQLSPWQRKVAGLCQSVDSLNTLVLAGGWVGGSRQRG